MTKTVSEELQLGTNSRCRGKETLQGNKKKMTPQMKRTRTEETECIGSLQREENQSSKSEPAPLTARPHSSVKNILERFCPFTLNGVTSLCLTFRRTALWEAERRFSGFSGLKSWAMFNFWSWGGSGSQSNPVYANLTVQASANQILCMQIWQFKL